ncbi:hypothetical protein DKX38_008651 [Salix brachista]|uniref:Dehydrin n=1 Tax=Salix brachista TaxID=2182728 RepID=A0A5N5MRW4_9ROSI|nr:hypothetical protein DKX38_008651 [Salix brachista]
MAEENKSYEYETQDGEKSGSVETKDRGLFNFLGKKEEEKPQEEVNAAEFKEKLKLSEHETKVEEEPKKEAEEEKKPSLFEKLHRSGSSSSSSDTSVPVEVVHTETPHETEEKKGFLEKIKQKLPGQNKKTEEVLPPPSTPESTPPPPSDVEYP